MRQSSYLYNSLMEILIQLERDMRKKTTKIPLYSIFLYHLTENKGRVIGNVKKKIKINSLLRFISFSSVM